MSSNDRADDERSLLRLARRCVALLTLGFAPHALAQEIPTDRPLAPDELFKLMENSEVTYTIGELPADATPERIVDILWPTHRGLSIPWIEQDETGRRSLVAYPFTDEDIEALGKVEPLFKERKFAKARKRYEAIAASHPKNYLAVSSIGDCHYLSEDHEAALPYYERALEMNPYHYVNYLKLGNTLAKLGRWEAALDTFVRGLVVRPRQEVILNQIRYFSKGLGVRVEDGRFLPRAYAERSEGGIAVHFDPDDGWPWLTWVQCKAVWLGEGEYRAARLEDPTANESYQPTSTEEFDCLRTLVVGYGIAREEREFPPDPMLDRLSRIAEEGLLQEFVVYELFSRISPDIALLIPLETHGLELRKYLEKFVVVKTP